MIRKAALSLCFLAIIAVLAVFIGNKLPSSFLPDEDQGYLFVGMQLPDAASLQRTSDAADGDDKNKRRDDAVVQAEDDVSKPIATVGMELDGLGRS